MWWFILRKSESEIENNSVQIFLKTTEEPKWQEIHKNFAYFWFPHNSETKYKPCNDSSKMLDQKRNASCSEEKNNYRTLTGLEQQSHIYFQICP